MEFHELTVKMDIKKALVEILTKHKDKQVLIAVSKELLKEFANKNEICENLYVEGVKVTNREFFIYNDNETGIRGMCGKATFQFFGGIWFLKKFNGFNCRYPKSFDEEAELMFFLTK